MCGAGVSWEWRCMSRNSACWPVISLIVFAVMKALNQQHPGCRKQITVRCRGRLLEELQSFKLAEKMRVLGISLSFFMPRVSNDSDWHCWLRHRAPGRFCPHLAGREFTSWLPAGPRPLRRAGAVPAEAVVAGPTLSPFPGPPEPNPRCSGCLGADR